MYGVEVEGVWGMLTGLWRCWMGEMLG